MSEAWIIALVGAGVGAILGAYLNPLFQTWFSGKPRMEVIASLGHFSLPETIRGILPNVWRELNGTGNVTDEQKSHIGILRHCEGMCHLNIKNTGRISIDDLNIEFDCKDGLIDVLYDGSRSYSKGNKINIGRLPVGRGVLITFWAPRDISTAWRDPVSVHANGLGRAKVKYVPIYYMSSRYYFYRKKYINIVIFLIFILYVIPVSVYGLDLAVKMLNDR
ncbi:hypothetical protein [Xanthobacter autotrophicus]|uniref:hypothetical protein n=1 Tax=Xanthobacter autotrophicus TaxID=280 RepID=UPI003727C25A